MRSICLPFVSILLLATAGCGGAGAPATSLEVTMTEFAFAPTALVVPPGEEITLTLANAGAIEHEFAIMQLGITAVLPYDEDDLAGTYWQVRVPAGQTQTFTFTAPAEPGSYQVICGLPGHAESGMLGTLLVQAP